MKTYPNKILVYITLFLVYIVSNAFGAERHNYGANWQSWSPYNRYLYLWGFQDGINKAYSNAASNWLPEDKLFQKPESTEVKKVRESTFLFFGLEPIRDVITDLYDDPANCYIDFSDIIYLARDKLRGENISQALIKAGKDAYEQHLLKEKYKD